MILSFFPTAEGFYDYTKNQYIYQYKDHLGNVRLSYKKNSENVLEILDRNYYYPFGMNFLGYHSVFDAMGTPYNYKYNGKELQETGMYDYGARFYMPDIGRWGVPDPESGQLRRWTPYNYALNNPIRFIDPDGRLSKSFIDEMMSKSTGDKTTWTNDGNGNFSDGNGNIARDTESDNNSNADCPKCPKEAKEGDRYTTKNFDLLDKSTWSDFDGFGPNITYVYTDGEWIDTSPPMITGTVPIGPGGVVKGVQLLKKLPSLDATGKVHGALPRVKDFVNFSKGELKVLLSELKQSVQQRLMVPVC